MQNNPKNSRQTEGPQGVPFGPGSGRGGPARYFGQKARAKNVKGTVRRLYGYLRRYPGALLGVLFAVAAATVLAVSGPLLLKVIIDRFIYGRGAPSGFTLFITVLSGVYIFYAFTNWLQIWVMVGISQRALRNLRQNLFDKLQTLSLSFYDSRPHGELMSRITNDVENISNVLTHSVTQLISGVLTTAGVAVMMFILNPLLAAVTLLIIPVMGVLTKSVARRTRQGFRAQQKELGILNGIIEETVTGERIVKAFGREKETVAEFSAVNKRLKSASIKAQIASGILHPVINFVNNIGFAVVAGTGGWLVLSGAATVGTVVAFLNYVRQFTRPLTQLAGLYNTIQSAIAGAERVFEIMDEKPTVTNSKDAEEAERLDGEVEFKDVTFSYIPGRRVLKNISFTAEPGQIIAFVGATGAGKTTIINLLTRFYDIESGSILLDGKDIRDFTKESLRSRLGVVLQDTFLFSATVADNIRYGKLDAADEEVKKAAEIANADHFIRHLPDGYGTMLSEEGSNLSQGQRQLLSISRAVLAQPSILILDEATSSVDSRTEIHIQEAMLRLMEGRTSFVIAHRLNTIRNADVIIVIDNGMIVEKGGHRELIQREGYYYNLYMRQFGDMVGAEG
ncbi:MAG: ABC transporter ATP-binding protein [Spirochaetia bacterium]